MRLRRLLTASAALALSAGIAAAAPSSADTSATNVTFSLAAGTLDISAVADATSSATVNAPAVAVTITDTAVQDGTGSLLGWTVSATATNLTGYEAGTTTANGTTIPRDNMVWLTTPGSLEADTTTNALVNGVAIGGVGFGGAFLTNVADSTSVPVLVAKATPLFGSGRYTYDATVTLAVPPNTEAGDYKGVITQTAV